MYRRVALAGFPNTDGDHCLNAHHTQAGLVGSGSLVSLTTLFPAVYVTALECLTLYDIALTLTARRGIDNHPKQSDDFQNFAYCSAWSSTHSLPL